jgi:hypothetical protein
MSAQAAFEVVGGRYLADETAVFRSTHLISTPFRFY